MSEGGCATGLSDGHCCARFSWSLCSTALSDNNYDIAYANCTTEELDCSLWSDCCVCQYVYHCILLMDLVNPLIISQMYSYVLYYIYALDFFLYKIL